MVGTYDSVFAPLKDVYLERSWVVAIYPSEKTVTFSLDLVLTYAHEKYVAPRPGERYCYVSADLTLNSTAPVEFEPSGAAPATDASGEHDLDNIDTFAPGEGSDDWLLEGSWGRMRAKTPVVDVLLK